MACALVWWTGELKTDIGYLLMRAITFALIILFEFKFIRSKFRYLVELMMFDIDNFKQKKKAKIV